MLGLPTPIKSLIFSEMAKEDAIHEMKSRRGSANSNRIFGSLG
jgi:hypothetical protein